MATDSYKFVVIGGGIASVCCSEQLANLDDKSSIAMISASTVVKSVSNVQRIGRGMESFDVAETSGESLFSTFKNVTIIYDRCLTVNPKEKVLQTKIGKLIHYDKLCIATGGVPKLVAESPFVIGIRDTETVKDFQKRLSNARRIVVVGNGGIATELIYEIQNVEVVWLVKHKSISATFVDAGAAEFFLAHLNARKVNETVSKRLKYTHAETQNTGNTGARGSALGPDWIEGLTACGAAKERNVHIEFECELERLLTPQEVSQKDSRITTPVGFDSFENIHWPVFVELTNGKIFGCDFIVSATGVSPSCPIEVVGSSKFALADDGGILVDSEMRTSIADIYAAGDVCTAGWKWSEHWMQMRLWTQARQMGAYAGRCIFNASNGRSTELDMCFELFTHVTNFFGFKVILLGRFNSQGLRPDHHAHIRARKGEEYVKILIQDGKVQGAVLVGETDLEETFENLILNAIDVSHLGDDLLNSTVDIEDYFD